MAIESPHQSPYGGTDTQIASKRKARVSFTPIGQDTGKRLPYNDHPVGAVSNMRRQSQKDQNGKGKQGAASCQGVDDPCQKTNRKQ